MSCGPAGRPGSLLQDGRKCGPVRRDAGELPVVVRRAVPDDRVVRVRRLGEDAHLGLVAGPLPIGHHPHGDPAGELGRVVLLDEREGQIQRGGDAAGRGDAALAHINGRGVHPDTWEPPGQVGGIEPVRGLARRPSSSPAARTDVPVHTEATLRASPASRRTCPTSWPLRLAGSCPRPRKPRACPPTPRPPGRTGRGGIAPSRTRCPGLRGWPAARHTEVWPPGGWRGRRPR